MSPTTPVTRSPVLLALLAIVLGILPAAPAALAQDNAAPPPSAETQASDTDPRPGLESPRDTLQTFLTAMAPAQPGEQRDLDQAVRTIDFPPGLLTSAKRQTAIELYDVLNRLERIDYADHPASLDRRTYTLYPNTDRSLRHLDWLRKYPDTSITMTRGEDGSWRFSRSTADSIHQLWIATESETPIVADDHDTMTLARRIRATLPKEVKGHLVLGLEPWQWIGILVVIAIGVVVDHVLRLLLRIGWHRFEAKRGNDVKQDVLNKAARPFGLLAAACIWYVALDQGLLPPTATTVLLVAVRLFLMVSCVWAAFRVTDLFTAWLGAQAGKTETKFDDLLVPLVQRAIKIFIAAIGLIYIASAFEIEILPLLTGLGIGGLAVAFAAKDTIENFFGSIAVILDRPFEIGDWIVTNDIEGTVEDLGLRSTRIRTFYNSLVTVPNATLVRATVDNYGRRKYRRYKTMVNITYDTHPDTIEAFCAGIREIIQLHPYTRKDSYHVWLNAFGAHSLDILVYMFFECPDWAIELREKQRFMLDIIRLADKLGVEFAFPTQTLHVFKGDADQIHEPKPTPETDAERRAKLAGARAAREITHNQPWKQDRPGPVEFKVELDADHEFRGNDAS